MLKAYRLTGSAKPLPFRRVQAPKRGGAAPYHVFYEGKWRRVYYTTQDCDYFIHRGRAVPVWPEYEREA